MPPSRWLLATLPIAFVPGCHRAPAPASMIPGAAAGTREYRQGGFRYDVMAPGQHLRGRVTIIDTLVLLEPVDDSCVRSGELPHDWRANPVVAFSCVGVPAAGGSPGQRTTFLQIHLRHPQTHSRWGRADRAAVVDLRPPQDRRCIRSTKDRWGREFCTRYEDAPLHQRATALVWQWGSLPLMPAHMVPPDTGRHTPNGRALRR